MLPGVSPTPYSSQSTVLNLVDSSQAGLYRDADKQNDYWVEPGVCILPLAQLPPTNLTDLATWSPVVKLQLHAPYRIRRFRYSAIKDNNPPIVPSPQNTGDFIYCGGTISFKTVLNSTECNFSWAVAADYYYVEACISRPQDGFVLGMCPWIYSMDVQNQEGYGSSVPSLGAISDAGILAVIGYNMSQASNPQTGDYSSSGWGYNSDTYFPGVLLMADQANAGPPANGSPPTA